MNTTDPQTQQIGAFRQNLPSIQSSVIAAGIAGSALLLWLTAASQGSAKSVLFLLGLALGVTYSTPVLGSPLRGVNLSP